MTSLKDALQVSRGRLSLLSLTALGVVFGDIGTSPLYTFKTILNLSGQAPDPNAILGLLSLILWTLFMITTIKYVSFAMRFDNDGEGGIMALMSLLGVKKRRRIGIIAFGLFGAALIYGDGAITPAISVLSALEGLEMVTPSLQPYIVPAAVVILLALFGIQSKGTKWIGRAFGPIMLLWFLSIATLGISGIIQHAGVLVALNPYYAFAYLCQHGIKGFLVLGGVFLCVTGAEALYADMGHVGRRPIWLSWYAIVFPSLILNYAGQAAIVIDGAPTDGNIFFTLCPPVLLIPMVILATLATIIASQAIISGAFSMTRQAILLGWLPRLLVKQTSSEGYGQIYIGVVNFVLMLATIALTISFGKSDKLAAAYGIAVSLTMLMTSVLLFIAMREIWRWSLFAAGAVAACFVILDGAFVLANFSKFAEGGYIPLLLAIVVYGMMWIWHRGAAAVMASAHDATLPVPAYMAKIKEDKIPRVPGTAVFMTRSEQGVPPVMIWHVTHNRALHEQILVLHVRVKSIPKVSESKRLILKELSPNFWAVEANYGFMEHPDIPELLNACVSDGCKLNVTDVTYYIGRDTIVAKEESKGLPAWQTSAFAMMERNATHVTYFFNLPIDKVVEIGRQISI